MLNRILMIAVCVTSFTTGPVLFAEMHADNAEPAPSDQNESKEDKKEIAVTADPLPNSNDMTVAQKALLKTAKEQSEFARDLLKRLLTEGSDDEDYAKDADKIKAFQDHLSELEKKIEDQPDDSKDKKSLNEIKRKLDNLEVGLNEIHRGKIASDSLIEDFEKFNPREGEEKIQIAKGPAGHNLSPEGGPSAEGTLKGTPPPEGGTPPVKVDPEEKSFWGNPSAYIGSALSGAGDSIIDAFRSLGDSGKFSDSIANGFSNAGDSIMGAFHSVGDSFTEAFQTVTGGIFRDGNPDTNTSIADNTPSHATPPPNETAPAAPPVTSSSSATSQAPATASLAEAPDVTNPNTSRNETIPEALATNGAITVPATSPALLVPPPSNGAAIAAGPSNIVSAAGVLNATRPNEEVSSPTEPLSTNPMASQKPSTSPVRIAGNFNPVNVPSSNEDLPPNSVAVRTQVPPLDDFAAPSNGTSSIFDPIGVSLTSPFWDAPVATTSGTRPTVNGAVIAAQTGASTAKSVADQMQRELIANSIASATASAAVFGPGGAAESSLPSVTSNVISLRESPYRRPASEIPLNVGGYAAASSSATNTFPEPPESYVSNAPTSTTSAPSPISISAEPIDSDGPVRSGSQESTSALISAVTAAIPEFTLEEIKKKRIEKGATSLQIPTGPSLGTDPVPTAPSTVAMEQASRNTYKPPTNILEALRKPDQTANKGLSPAKKTGVAEALEEVDGDEDPLKPGLNKKAVPATVKANKPKANHPDDEVANL